MCSAYIQSFSLLVHFSDVNFFFHGPTDRPTFGIIEAPVPELKNGKSLKFWQISVFPGFFLTLSNPTSGRGLSGFSYKGFPQGRLKKKNGGISR